MPLVSRKITRASTQQRSAFVLPGVTAVVIIPHTLRRAIGGLARKKDGRELKMRINDYDHAMIVEGAKLCGLSMADYARQCAINMTQAIKGQTDAPRPITGSTETL